MAQIGSRHLTGIVFDGRYINDRYHGIGRYAFHVLAELSYLFPHACFRVLRDPSLLDSRFDWTGLETRPNVQIEEVSAPPFTAREQLAVPGALRSAGRVIYHSPYFAVPWLNASTALVTVHDCIFERDARYMPGRWARLYYRLLVAYSVRRSRAVFVPSRATAADVRRFYNVPRSRLVITPEAADPAFRPVDDRALLDDMRARYRLPVQFVLAVGARRPHKNFGMLVRAMAQVPGAALAFVGDADERFPDEARLAARQTGADVRFLGKVPEADLPLLYNLASVVACPSLVEGFGLPVLEAMSCGTPVVCSAIPVFREVAGDAALLAGTHNVEQWVSSLRSVLANPPLAERLSAGGLARAAQFNWRRAAEAIASVYRRTNGPGRQDT